MSSPPPPPTPSLAAQNWAFFLRHHLALGIVIGVAVGALWPAPGRALSAIPFTTIAIALIFFIQGLKLETEEAKDALKSWRASLYGFVFILFLSPFLCFPVRWLPLEPAGLTVGLCLFLTMPGTISSGVVFTRECYGNASLALLLSVGTTLVSIVTMPFTIPFFALSGGADIDRWAFLINLCLTILLPLAVGKSIRQCVPRALHWIERTSTATKYTMSIALLLLPFIQVSNSTDQIRELSFTAVLYTVVLGSLIHVVLLAVNVLVCRFFAGALQLDLAKQRAIVLCCSEKTLAIAVAILPLLAYDEGAKGVVVVAVIIAHLAQIVMDGILSSYWKSKTDEERARTADAGEGSSAYVQMETGGGHSGTEETTSADRAREELKAKLMPAGTVASDATATHEEEEGGESNRSANEEVRQISA